METKAPLIFVVDDDPGFNRLMSSYLTVRNIGSIESFLTGEECLEKIHEHPDIILLDYNLPVMNGLDVLREVKKKSPETIVIFLSGQTDVNTVIETIKEGALDYIVKDNYAKENALYKIDQLTKTKKESTPEIKNDSAFYL